MDRNGLLIFFGLLLIAGAIFARADNGRYAYIGGTFHGYQMVDTRTGAAWLCGQYQDACINTINKAAYLASDKASRDIADPPPESAADKASRDSVNPFAPPSDADARLGPP